MEAEELESLCKNTENSVNVTCFSLFYVCLSFHKPLSGCGKTVTTCLEIFAFEDIFVHLLMWQIFKFCTILQKFLGFIVMNDVFYIVIALL